MGLRGIGRAFTNVKEEIWETTGPLISEDGDKINDDPKREEFLNSRLKNRSSVRKTETRSWRNELK